MANLSIFISKNGEKKPRNLKKFHPAFFSFSEKQIRQVCQNSKKILIVIDTGLGETVIGSIVWCST